MEKLNKILDLYQEVCRHCDRHFQRACEKFAGQIRCVSGCHACCIIQSVTRLEAFVIEEYVRSHEVQTGSSGESECIFVDGNGLCAIYPARPIICRTHGLMLYNSEEKTLSRTCEKNFKGLGVDETDSLRSVNAIDELNLAENLARLNLAFLKLTGEDFTGTGRIRLRDLKAL